MVFILSVVFNKDGLLGARALLLSLSLPLSLFYLSGYLSIIYLSICQPISLYIRWWVHHHAMNINGWVLGFLGHRWVFRAPSKKEIQNAELSTIECIVQTQCPLLHFYVFNRVYTANQSTHAEIKGTSDRCRTISKGWFWCISNFAWVYPHWKHY